MIADATMRWHLDDLCTNEALRDARVTCVPSSEGVCFELNQMPGTDPQQIVIERLMGYENLISAENRYEANRGLVLGGSAARLLRIGD